MAPTPTEVAPDKGVDPNAPAVETLLALDPQLKKLQEQLVAVVKSHTDAATAATSQAFKTIADAMNARIVALEARVNEQLASRVVSVPGSADATHKGQKFSFSRFYAGVASKNLDVCPLEAEICREAKKQTRAVDEMLKAMGVVPDSAGGFVVPIEVLLDQVIELLYANSVVADLGATKLSNLTAIPTALPRVSGGTIAYWVHENAAITASQLTLEQLRLVPHPVAALTVRSHLLGNVGNPGIDEMIKSDQAMQIGLLIDKAALLGTGADGEPIGVKNELGVNTSTYSDPTTYDELLAFMSKVRGANAQRGKLGWAVSNDDMLEFEQMKDVTGGTDNKSNIQPLQRRTLLNPDGTQLLGRKVLVSTQLAANDVFYGNWADMVMAQWGGMWVDMTNAVGFVSAQEHVRSIMYVDVGLRHVKSFCRKA